MIKAIVLDLDNTLHDEELYFLKVFEVFAKNHKVNFLKIRNIFDEKLRIVSKDIFGDVLKGLDIYSKGLQEELFSLYKTIDTRLELYEDAADFITFARKHMFKLALLTNGVIEAQRNKIRCLSISDYFDEILFARQFGKEKEKPNKKPFREISKRLKVKPSDLIFIGDNPDTDFKGAKEIGGITVRLKRGLCSSMPSNKFMDMEIDDLRELERILCAE